MHESSQAEGRRMAPTLWVAAILAATMAAAGCQRTPKQPTIQASRTEARDLPKAPGPLQIRLKSGDVVIVPDPDAKRMQMDLIYRSRGVGIDAVLSRLSARDVVVDQVDGVLQITQVTPGDDAFEESVDITIRFPVSQPLDLDVTLDSGSMRIQGINGKIRLQGLEGDMEARDCNGEMTLFTRNGDITVLNSHGTLTANTDNGDMIIKGHSGNGIRATCVVGDLDIELTRDGQGPLIADTSNGRINLSVSAEFNGNLNMGAPRGNILVEDPGARIVESSEDEGERSVIIGDGGSISSLGTSTGSIVFRIRPLKRAPAEQDTSQ
jgi:DUF4097 and DUF4098 domain-containing protein YvlB